MSLSPQIRMAGSRLQSPDHTLPNVRFNRSGHIHHFNLKCIPQKSDILLFRPNILHKLGNVLCQSPSHTLEFGPVRYCAARSDEEERSDYILPKRATHDYSSMTKSDLLDICTATKAASLALQEYLTICPLEIAAELSVRIYKLNLIRRLSASKFGCYVIQRLVKRDPWFRGKFQQFAEATFPKSATNEFVSRIMQACVELDPEFRVWILHKSPHHFEILSNSAASMILIQLCIKRSESESEYLFIVKLLQNDPHFWQQQKYFQRILVPLVHVCSEPVLNILFDKLNLQTAVNEFLQRKYSTYIVVTMISRGFQKMIEALRRVFKEDIRGFVRLQFFRLFFLQLRDFGLHFMLQELANSVDEELQKQIGFAGSHPLDYYFLCYILASTADDQLFVKHAARWKSLYHELSNSLKA